jgi:hypothetical protein
MKSQLITEIKAKLSILSGAFIDAEIAEYIAPLQPSQYSEFFKALSSIRDDEYAFKKGIDRVAIVAKRFAPQSDHEAEARVIASLLHDINKIVTQTAESKGIDYLQLMKAIRIRESFNLTDKQAYVMNEIGGREVIMKINTTEPNTLERKIIESLKKYERDNVVKTISVAKGMNRNLIAELAAQKRG